MIGRGLNQSSFSPRLAFNYKLNAKTNLKLLYGHGFANPSSYDKYYSDNGLTQVANPSLRPESTNTFEVDGETQISRRVHVTASFYHYQVSNLIQLVFDRNNLEQFVNTGAVRASGASFELRSRLPRNADMKVSLELQRARYGDGAALPNSPSEVGKWQFSVPLWRNWLVLGAGVEALGRRETFGGAVLPWRVPAPTGCQYKTLRGRVAVRGWHQESVK